MRIAVISDIHGNCIALDAVLADLKQESTNQIVCLRFAGQQPTGRLQPSMIHESMKLKISLHSVDEVDAEVLGWLRWAYHEND